VLTLFLDDACKVAGLQGVPDLLLVPNSLGSGRRDTIGIPLPRRPGTELVLLEDDVQRTPDGQVVRWGGNTYGPTLTQRRWQLAFCSHQACQRRLFAEVMQPGVQPCTAGNLVIVEDLNFVANAACDRSTLPFGAASNPDRSADETIAVQVFTDLKTGGRPMVDEFRPVHSQAHGYTHQWEQWHLWLVDPHSGVCEIVWWVVVLAAIWAMSRSGSTFGSSCGSQAGFCSVAGHFKGFHLV
jgi:hypothetical protein